MEVCHVNRISFVAPTTTIVWRKLNADIPQRTVDTCKQKVQREWERQREGRETEVGSLHPIGFTMNNVQKKRNHQK